MKLLRLQSALALTVAGALAFGCSGGDDDDDGTVTPPRDGGVTNTDRDAGVRDAGGSDPCGDGVCDSAAGEDFISCPVDCPPPDNCPDGEEGCECNSTWTDGDPAFLQDDCQADLLCVPFDNLSGRTADLNGPLQSCVRPCVTDTDCGMNDDGSPRFCVDGMEYPGSSAPVGMICVDSIAAQDEYCGASRNVTPRLTGVEAQTGSNMVGCGGDAECIFGVFQDLNVDEGVCLQFCGQDGLPNCPTENPYCNPNLFTTTATDGTQLPLGICSVGQLGLGSWCGSENPNGAGLTGLCDTADTVQGEVVCVGLGITLGNCMELCDTTANPPAQPCSNTYPGLGDYYCVDGLLNSGGGICFVPDAQAFPDNCGADGGLGLGQLPLTLTQEGDSLCVDRLGPAHNPGTVTSMGQLMGEGDNCQDPADDMSGYRCPEGTVCFGTQTGGSCLAGCSRGPMADPTYCEGLLTDLGLGTTNATCAEIPPFMDPTVGLCGGD